MLGLVGVAAALTRPAAELVDALPSLLGAAGDRRRAAAAPAPPAARRRSERTRRWVHSTYRKPRSLHRASATLPPDPGPADDGGLAVDRRAFLGAAALVAAGAAAAGGGAALLGRSASGTACASRCGSPPPRSRLRRCPPASTPGFVTTNADFYRVDTALTVPRVDLASWRLTIGGMVDSPVELSFADLLDRPLVERVVTLNCVSNEVGGPYIGTARWLGVPLAPLLREVGVRPGADQLLARSVDGMTIGTPTAALLDGREPLLCVGMNGEPLPVEHGFPVRMLTPGLYGYVGACKWLRELEATTFADVDAYWVERGWAPQGTVKTASRIDRPAPFARLAAGTVPVAGVAWAQGRGIRAVEVQVDDGAVAAGDAAARAVGRHLGAVALRLAGHPRLPHAVGTGDGRHRRGPAGGARRPVPGRRHRLAHDHGVRRVSGIPPRLSGRRAPAARGGRRARRARRTPARARPTARSAGPARRSGSRRAPSPGSRPASRPRPAAARRRPATTSRYATTATSVAFHVPSRATRFLPSAVASTATSTENSTITR